MLFQEMTREQISLIASRALVVLPIGAVEQHGPHLPVGTDYLVVETLTKAAAERARKVIPIVVAPTLPFGSSHYHLPFGGTISLGTETYYKVIYELVESLIISGFRHIFIVNGHGGNHEIVQLATRDLAVKHDAHLAAGSYWCIAWEALVAKGAHTQGKLPGHAGAFETSLMLALRPELVTEPRPQRNSGPAADLRGITAPYRTESHGWWQKLDGFTDSPHLGTRHHGQVYLECIVEALSAAFIAFYTSTRGETA